MRTRIKIYTVLFLFLSFISAQMTCGSEIPIVVDAPPQPTESALAEELANYLQKVFLSDTFAVTSNLPDCSCIAIGRVERHYLINSLPESELSRPGLVKISLDPAETPVILTGAILQPMNN